ncbi:hypothetical protein PCH_Pc14g01880 [Penicillium rubens Wisconsin 54-1255]|uniref:Uncharacterized protein n=1 Tax=Penicillium rubens (strain ATCC 28089 / DSM 1075 / NRRL 1951 / Wisconsin 54-1255) TaxID=500485 RepID=B6H616_PENRW|nr:hypothetical protein PCH_Pc14g01880 [Penicillium rubens Wisconsin 54-1255]
MPRMTSCFSTVSTAIFQDSSDYYLLHKRPGIQFTECSGAIPLDMHSGLRSVRSPDLVAYVNVLNTECGVYNIEMQESSKSQPNHEVVNQPIPAKVHTHAQKASHAKTKSPSGEGDKCGGKASGWTNAKHLKAYYTTLLYSGIGYGLGFCGCSWVLAGSLGGWCISVFTVISLLSMRMQGHSVDIIVKYGWWDMYIRGVCLCGKGLAYWVMGLIFSLCFRAKGIQVVNWDIRVYGTRSGDLRHAITCRGLVILALACHGELQNGYEVGVGGGNGKTMIVHSMSYTYRGASIYSARTPDEEIKHIRLRLPIVKSKVISRNQQPITYSHSSRLPIPSIAGSIHRQFPGTEDPDDSHQPGPIKRGHPLRCKMPLIQITVARLVDDGKSSVIRAIDHAWSQP